MTEKYWMGTPPETCDTCEAAIDLEFIDGATKMGPWAHMCPTCFILGPGLNKLGLGIGQRYQKQDDGRFKKIGG